MPRRRFVGQNPWSAADAPVGLLAPCERLTTWSRQRDGGVSRRRDDICPGNTAQFKVVAVDRRLSGLRCAFSHFQAPKPMNESPR